MFAVDPEAIRRLAETTRDLPTAQVRATAVAGFTRLVIEASERGDLETIKRLSLSFGDGGMSARISTDEKHPWVTTEIPFGVRMARQLALEGRRPRVTLSVPASVLGIPWRP